MNRILNGSKSRPERFFHLDSMGSDRRGADRIPLDTPYALTVSGAGKSGIRCRLLDVSLTGIRLELSEAVGFEGSIGSQFRLGAT